LQDTFLQVYDPSIEIQPVIIKSALVWLAYLLFQIVVEDSRMPGCDAMPMGE
jgi:hypothetical protein